MEEWRGGLKRARELMKAIPGCAVTSLVGLRKEWRAKKYELARMRYEHGQEGRIIGLEAEGFIYNWRPVLVLLLGLRS